ncbi:MAG: AAA family ATPase [Anaerolineales bacterium]|nr:AAA family ATPase [Anaerolineales bacterium]
MYLDQIKIHSDLFPTDTIYPFNIPVIRKTNELAITKPICFFVGENGSGKSTLLDAIARKCSIHIWQKPKRHLAHNNPLETRLKDFITPQWTNGIITGSYFSADTFHDLADFLDDVALCDPGRLKYHGGKIINTQSHGQGILSYFSGRLKIQGLYFLDEPEAALSPASQLELVEMLQVLAVETKSQFIIATHSPILFSCPGSQILYFDQDAIREVDYKQTDHYRIYRRFFTD